MHSDLVESDQRLNAKMGDGGDGQRENREKNLNTNKDSVGSEQWKNHTELLLSVKRQTEASISTGLNQPGEHESKDYSHPARLTLGIIQVRQHLLSSITAIKQSYLQSFSLTRSLLQSNKGPVDPPGSQT